MIEQLLHRSCCTWELWGIWLLEAINFYVHVTARPVPWNFTSTAIGYTLWALQLTCFAMCQLTEAGSPPADWEERMRESADDVSVCKRTGLLLPPRAQYVRRAGGVVLGLDHYCHWIGTPVGLRNRKFFVLFVVYSAVFCAMGAAHSLLDICLLTPRRLGVPTLFDAVIFLRGVAARETPHALLQLLHSLWDWWHALFAQASGNGESVYVLALAVTAVANPLAALFLGCGAMSQLLLVTFNRTTLAPLDNTYDVGLVANWVQVFGAQPYFWPLPLAPRPISDGLSFPRNPDSRYRRRPTRTVRDLRDPSNPPPPPPKVKLSGGRLMRCVRTAIICWESWFCCGMLGVGCFRYAARLFLLYRSKRGRPFVPQD